MNAIQKTRTTVRWKRKFLFFNFLFPITLAIIFAACKKDSSDLDNSNDDGKPGTTEIPPIAGITSTDAGKVSENIFTICYEKLTQTEQDAIEPLVSSFRNKTKSGTQAASDNGSDDAAWLAAAIAGEGYSLSLIGTAASSAVLKDENNPFALFNFGGYLRIADMNDHAFTVLQRAAQLAPNSAPILSALGCSYFDKGDLDNAEKQFKEALKIDADCAFATEGLAAVYLKQGRNDLAVENYCKTVLYFSPNADVNGLTKINKAIDQMHDAQKQKRNSAVCLDATTKASASIAPLAPLFQSQSAHVERRPRLPQFVNGSEEQYAGSMAAVIAEYMMPFSMQIPTLYSQMLQDLTNYLSYYNANKGKQGKDEWIGYSIEHIDWALSQIDQWLNVEAFDIPDVFWESYSPAITNPVFTDGRSTYAQALPYFKQQLNAFNNTFDELDDLLDKYYATTQLWMDKLNIEDDYKLYDYTRRASSMGLFQPGVNMLYALAREDREPILSLPGSPLVRSFHFPELILFKDCKFTTVEKETKLVDFGLDYKVWFTATFRISCDHAELWTSWHGSKGEIKPLKDNIILKPFQKFCNMSGGFTRSSFGDNAEAIYISNRKLMGQTVRTAMSAERIPDIVPGKQGEYIGLFCGVEIK